MRVIEEGVFGRWTGFEGFGIFVRIIGGRLLEGR